MNLFWANLLGGILFATGRVPDVDDTRPADQLSSERSPSWFTNRQTRFERKLLDHMPAAYNLARWLTRSRDDAEDVVQEAYLRAFRFRDRFKGGDEKVWLLTIVRNTAYTCLRNNRASEAHTITVALDVPDGPDTNPEVVVLSQLDAELLMRQIDDLPVEFREVVILRDVDELSYREIAQIIDAPIGTVTSRLARGRARLIAAARELASKEEAHDLR